MWFHCLAKSRRAGSRLPELVVCRPLTAKHGEILRAKTLAREKVGDRNHGLPFHVPSELAELTTYYEL